MIKKHLARLIDSKFILAGSLASFSTLVKILSVFVITKYISVQFGPEKLGLYGQTQSFINFILAFSTFSSGAGITKYLSEYSNKSVVRTKIALAAWEITFVCSTLTSILVIVFSKYISEALFFSEKHFEFVMVIGFSTFFLSAYKTRIAILNGYFKFQNIAFWEIILNIIIPIILVGLSLITQDAILISLSISHIVVFFFMNSTLRINPIHIISRFKYLKDILIPLLKFSFLILIQTAIGYGVEILLRLFLVEKLSLSDLGLYEGMNKVSGAILLPVSSIISIYFFPIFSNRENGSFGVVLGDSINKMIPILLVFLVILYVFRVPIITLILSSKFEVLGDYFHLQLSGLLISVINLLFMNAMLGRGLIKVVFVLTICFSIFFLVSSYFLISSNGLAGSFYAYTITAFFGLVAYTLFYLTQKHKFV